MVPEDELPQDIADPVSDAAARHDVPPLARYERLPHAESDIRILLGVRGRPLVDAFRPPDGAADHRCTEALIFFLLRALREADTRSYNGMFEILVGRCQGFFRGRMRGLLDDDERMTAQSLVFEKIVTCLDQGGTACDYMQARFWGWLHRRMLTAIGDVQRQRRKEWLTNDRVKDDEDASAAEPAAHDVSAEDILLIGEGLAQLPEDLRQLYILRYFENWRVGDDRKPNANTDDPTLADLYGVSATAIKKRLAKAERLLADYRKDPA